MIKPDMTDTGSQLHHWHLQHAQKWLCEHTCKAHMPSIHRSGRGAGPHDHADPNNHANRRELETLPDAATTLALAQDLMTELFAFDQHIPAHLYAAIYMQITDAITQATQAIAAIAAVPPTSS